MSASCSKHRRCNVFEADAGLDDGYIVGCTQLVEHRSCAEGFDNWAAFAAYLQQVVGKQPVDPQLVDELAVLIAEAAAVGVSVKDADAIGFDGASQGEAGVHIWGDWLRAGHFGKGRIALRVDFDDIGPAARQDFAQPAGAVAPHAVDDDLQAGVADVGYVDQSVQMGQIGGLRLDIADRATGQGRVERRAAHAFRTGDAGFDRGQALRRYSAAAGVAHLEAVVFGRIVAGGDVYRADRVVVDGGEADDRRRRGIVNQQNAEAVAGEHLGHGGGEMFSLEAFVVADDDLFGGVALICQPVGKALCAAAHICKGVVFGHASAPTVRAEANGRLRYCFSN